VAASSPATRERRDRWLALAEARLATAGRRAGAARTAVVETLAIEGQCLISAQALAEALPAGGAGSVASVYRALEQLHDLGLVRRVIGDDGVTRFEIADPAGGHHHVVDPGSGAVRPFVDAGVDRAVRDAARRLGVALDGYDLVLRGRAVEPGTPDRQRARDEDRTARPPDPPRAGRAPA
jgi:Fur family ferric uptake transcriptional regulator